MPGALDMTYKGRLFTFGCSFTSFNWVTWADLLGKEFEEHYNYGHQGGGNLFIACSVAEAMTEHNITADDTVMIMWTGVAREDRYLTNKWMAAGDIFAQSRYPKEFVENYVSLRGCYVRDLAQIQLVNQALQNIGCKYEFLSIVDIDKRYDEYQKMDDKYLGIKDVLKLYKSVLRIIKPSFHKTIFDYDWEQGKPLFQEGTNNLVPRRDLHPLPTEHIEYLNAVLPEYKLSDETIRLAKEITADIKTVFTERRNNEEWGSSDWDYVTAEKSSMWKLKNNLEKRI